MAGTLVAEILLVLLLGAALATGLTLVTSHYGSAVVRGLLLS